VSGAYCFWQRTERLRQVATLQTLLQARAYPSSPQMTPRERARISISVQIFGWPLRVRLGIARAEQNESALPRAADMRADVMGGLRPANGRDQMREALSNKEHAARPPDKTVSVIASVWRVSLRYVGTCLCDLAILN